MTTTSNSFAPQSIAATASAYLASGSVFPCGKAMTAHTLSYRSLASGTQAGATQTDLILWATAKAQAARTSAAVAVGFKTARSRAAAICSRV